MNRFILTGLFIAVILTACKSGKQENNVEAAGNAGESGKNIINAGENANVIYLTDQTFKELVFDYEKDKEWKYKGTKPAIIDFYADWCAPCRELSPILEELAREYDGKFILYKVDTEKEKELTRTMGITGLPTLLYIPLNGKPQVRMGLVPKESLAQAIDEVLIKK